jgi:hypothetical protein
VRLFRINACVLLGNGNGTTATRQVPTFFLDSDCHGLLDEPSAQEFAEDMLTKIGHDVIQVSAHVADEGEIDG